MKNLTKMGLLSALAAVTLSVYSCKKSNDVKTDNVQPAEAKGPGKLKTESMNLGLVAYWPLDGNGTDASGNGHTATITGLVTATADQFGNTGHAMHFNNTTATASFMSVVDAADLRLYGTDYTINAWVKLDSYNSGSGSDILSKRTATPTGWGCSITGTSYPNGAGFSYIGVGGHGSGNAISQGTVSTGTWHMVTYVYHNSAATMDMYIDGVNSDPNSTPISFTPSNSTANMTIGVDNASSNYYFNGDMDEIRIYSKALTPADITTLKNAPSPGGIIAYWTFDGNANDFSGNGFNGSPTNITSVADHFVTNGLAYGFNGTSSYVTVPDNVALRLNNTDFTLNAWVKINSYGSSSLNIMAKRSSTPEGWGWSITSAGVGFFGAGGLTMSASGSTVVPAGAWHMVTVTFQKTSPTEGIVAHYVDGVQSGSAVLHYPMPSASVTNPLVIGRDDLGPNYFFNGSIDDIRIYNKILSPSYLTTLFTTKY